MKISTYSDLFRYLFHDSKVNSFFNLFQKQGNFMNASQNKCSGFTELSTDFSTSYFVDNVYNFVYNSIFSHFPPFSMWITFFRPTFFFCHILEIVFYFRHFVYLLSSPEICRFSVV